MALGEWTRVGYLGYIATGCRVSNQGSSEDMPVDPAIGLAGAHVYKDWEKRLSGECERDARSDDD
jgi:hypothetical protein